MATSGGKVTTSVVASWPEQRRMRALAPSKSMIFTSAIGVVHYEPDSNVEVLHNFCELGLVGTVNLLRER